MKDTTVPVSTQLDLFKTKPTASLGSSPGPVMHVMGSGKKPVIKEKQTYPFDTPQGIDHVTRVLKEEAPDKLSPRQEADLNILNKEMKLSVLKDEIGGLKQFDNLNPDSYPSSPEQRRRLKNIDKLEKSLGYNSPEINVPYKKDIRTPNRKKADAWEANKRTIQQLRKLKEWGQNPLTKTNYSKGGTVNNSNSRNLIKQTSKSPTEISEIKKTVNNHVKSMGTTKYHTPDKYKYFDKKEEPKPSSVVRNSDTKYLDPVTTAPGPIAVPEIPVEQIIKELADARLEAEQKNWDRRYGKGGLPSLKRPE